MPVTDLLERNHKLYGDEVALVELNPTRKDNQKKSWKEYDLVQQTSDIPYRREITWSVFDEKANRVANMLLARGVQKGDRGSDSHVQLSGVAAHLLRNPEGRSHCGAFQFPL